MPTQQEDWAQRIDRVIDHIEAHLDEPLTREDLARVAAFSPFHFHRVFAAVTGETLFSFIQRLRLERCAGRLLDDPSTPIQDIAVDHGFSSASTFARSFKAHFGVSATTWRNEGKAERNPRKPVAKLRRTRATVELYVEDGPRWELTMHDLRATIRVAEHPRRHVAYVRTIGDYLSRPEAVFGPLYTDLMRWSAPRGHDGPVLTVFHDDPDITDASRLRVSMGVEVSEDTEVRAPVGRMSIPPGAYASGTFTLPRHRSSEPWQALFADWMPAAGFVPDERPAYETWEPGEPRTFTVHVPVRPR